VYKERRVAENEDSTRRRERVPPWAHVYKNETVRIMGRSRWTIKCKQRMYNHDMPWGRGQKGANHVRPLGCVRY